jgi:hypothetical protein
MAAVELDRRWKALQLAEDAEHHARWEAIGQRLQERFEREDREHKAQVQLEKRLADWLAALPVPPAPSAGNRRVLALPATGGRVNTPTAIGGGFIECFDIASAAAPGRRRSSRRRAAAT